MNVLKTLMAAMAALMLLAMPALADNLGTVSLGDDNGSVRLCAPDVMTNPTGCQILTGDRGLGRFCRSREQVSFRDFLATVAGYPNYEQQVLWQIKNCAEGAIFNHMKVGYFCIQAYNRQTRVCAVGEWYDDDSED